MSLRYLKLRHTLSGLYSFRYFKEMDERRNFQRYNVANIKQISGRIDRRTTDKRLVTLGLGGCGFWGDVVDERYVEGKNLVCQFNSEWTGPQTIEIQGTIVFTNTFTVKGKKVYFYGVQFLPAHQDRIRPVAEKLEQLFSEGKIKAA